MGYLLFTKSLEVLGGAAAEVSMSNMFRDNTDAMENVLKNQGLVVADFPIPSYELYRNFTNRVQPAIRANTQGQFGFMRPPYAAPDATGTGGLKISTNALYESKEEYFVGRIEKALEALETSEQHLSGILDQAKKANETLGQIPEKLSSPGPGTGGDGLSAAGAGPSAAAAALGIAGNPPPFTFRSAGEENRICSAPVLGPGQAEETEDRYSQMLENMSAATERILGRSVDSVFSAWDTGLENLGGTVMKSFAGILENMAGQLQHELIYKTMGDYAANLGVLTALAGKAFAALRSMNPLLALAAGAALVAIGARLRGLASGVGRSGGGYGGASAEYSGLSSGSGTSSGPGQASVATQVIIIDSGGARRGGSLDVDRALDRADLDRSLRSRLRELTRTGAQLSLA